MIENTGGNGDHGSGVFEQMARTLPHIKGGVGSAARTRGPNPNTSTPQNNSNQQGQNKSPAAFGNWRRP